MLSSVLIVVIVLLLTALSIFFAAQQVMKLLGTIAAATAYISLGDFAACLRVVGRDEARSISRIS